MIRAVRQEPAMAVYRRHYQPYAGELTSRRSRFLVLSRYAIAELLGSRWIVLFLMLAMVPILGEGFVIYLSHSAAARALLGMAKMSEVVRIDTGFFASALSTQCFFGFVLAAWMGPSLVAADLVHGALPLYLSRPLSRFQYVLGKATVLVVLLSAITWVSGLLLYLLNAAFAGDGWGLSHLRIALALVAGSLVWIAVVTLLSLAFSAWIKSRLGASAALFGVFFVSAGLGEAAALVLRTSFGRILNLGDLFKVVWAALFAAPHPERGVPLFAAWLALGAVCVFSLIVIERRLRAREVVR
jgi:ABC-2 type transport system permease protein